jgi:hypothetical protein
LRRTLSRGAVETIHARGFTWDANAVRVKGIFAALLDGRIRVPEPQPRAGPCLPAIPGTRPQR